MEAPKIRLLWLVPNNAWAFVFGDSMLRVTDNPTFYTSRREAVAAAKRAGLRVARNGSVTTIK